MLSQSEQSQADHDIRNTEVDKIALLYEIALPQNL
jgi:hypothetical protein